MKRVKIRDTKTPEKPLPTMGALSGIGAYFWDRSRLEADAEKKEGLHG